MKKLLLGIILILSVGYANAQEQLTLKQQADQLYNRYEYYKSLYYYLKLSKKKHTDVKILERIADCYRRLNLYKDAEEWYAGIVLDTKADRISHYYYAEVLLRNRKFDLAKEQYQLYFTNDPKRLSFKLATCDSAITWMAQKPVFVVYNAGNINSQYSDWGPVFDGKTSLIFTSDRETGDGDIDNRTGNNWFKLYQTDMLTQKTKAFALSDDNEFRNTYHAGPIALNKTRDTAYITITTEVPLKKLALDKPAVKDQQKLSTRRLQLLMARKRSEDWVIINSFPHNNIQQYSVGNAALSNDGRVIYFTSDMPGGEGKIDIWYCEKQADGTWSKPTNCGKTINTKDEENFPTIGGDGTLYFSSKGLPGMGGYDIYAAKGEKANWSIPQNLRSPLNTTSDDFYFSTTDGQSGYLSSNREGSLGSDDIYAFALKPDSLPEKPKPVAKTHKPDTIFVVPQPDLTVKTIYYDLNRSFIRPDAAAELNNLIIILKQHPELSVQLSSYTDSRASYKYNLALSKRRAKTAVNYLVNAGISPSRLTANGYGKTHLVNNCAPGVKCTEAEHQLNRRTEFKLIDNHN